MITMRMFVIVSSCFISIPIKTMEFSKNKNRTLSKIDQRERDFLYKHEMVWRNQRDIQFWNLREVAYWHQRERKMHAQNNRSLRPMR